MLNVFFLAIRMVLKGTSYSVLRPVRSLLVEMLFFMKLLCCEICLIMTLMTQVSKNQEYGWRYRLEQSMH